MNKRAFLFGLGGAFAAPAIVKLSSLMPIKQIIQPNFEPFAFTFEKITINAQSRALKAEYTLEIQPMVSAIYIPEKWKIENLLIIPDVS